MNKIRRVIFDILKEMEGIEQVVETKNSNPLKEMKATVNVCLTEMSEITNKMLGRWSQIQNSKISEYEKIAYSLSHKYVKYLDVSDKEEVFQELVAAGMEGIMHGLTGYTRGLDTKVSTFVFSRARFAIQKQFHAIKKDIEKNHISLNAKIDENNDEGAEFQSLMASPINTEDIVERRVRHQSLHAALCKLPTFHKKIAIMCSKFSVNQVAKKTNVSIGEVHAVLSTLRTSITAPSPLHI